MNDIENFMNIHRNEIERIRYFLELHKISSRWITDFRLCRLVLGDKVGIYSGLAVHWNGWELLVE